MGQYIWGDKDTQFFYELNPAVILDAIEDLGFKTTGRCLTLNSFENRVYEIEVEQGELTKQIVAKFYRPGRWSKDQILNEHQFMSDLDEAEIPLIAPLTIKGETLFKLEKANLWYCVYEKKGGRHNSEMNTEQLEILGRSLARLHNVGSTKSADHRITINQDSFGLKNLDFLIQSKLIPNHIENKYKEVVQEICDLSAPMFESISNIRVHGDCHLGNVIWRDESLFFIDFDDMLMGPAIQDIWLCVPGIDTYSLQDRAILIEAYSEFRDFNRAELQLIEPLRALRFIHFSAWIGNRINDPAFKIAFAHYGSEQYWQGQYQDLNDQLMKIKNYQQPLFNC